MNNQITSFSRLAGLTVNKALSSYGNVPIDDKAKTLINNANLINESLVKYAVKILKRASNKHDNNIEELKETLNGIIHLSVTSYIKRVA